MIITDLYKTELSSSKYNLSWLKSSEPTDDSPVLKTETVTITVKLTDFNNNPVKNKSVSVSCDKGFFTGDVRSKTLTTNNSGIATVDYWTWVFEVDVIRCNDQSIMINAMDTGWIIPNVDNDNITQFNQGSLTFKYRRVGNFVETRGAFTNSSAITFNGTSDGTTLEVCRLPLSFAPLRSFKTVQQGSGAYKFYAQVNSSGIITLGRYNDSTTMSHDIPASAWINMNMLYMVGDTIISSNFLKKYAIGGYHEDNGLKSGGFNYSIWEEENNTEFIVNSNIEQNYDYYFPLEIITNKATDTDMEVTCLMYFGNYSDNPNSLVKMMLVDKKSQSKRVGIVINPKQGLVLFGDGDESNGGGQYANNSSSLIPLNNEWIRMTIQISHNPNSVKFTVGDFSGEYTRKSSALNFSGEYYLVFGYKTLSYDNNTQPEMKVKKLRVNTA